MTTVGFISNFQKSSEPSGLEFILSHLSGPSLPRKISTMDSKDSQFVIESKDKLLTAYRDSGFKDCRINAFPLLREDKSWVPDLFFIDLDLADLQSRKKLDIVLSKTLRNISKYLGKDAKPTVLWSGNGYHVIQPVECPVTEYVLKQSFKEFTNSQSCTNPAEEFLRFAKILFSDNKADKNHNPSFRSCLLRIPGSINLKNGNKVQIVKEWNGYRPTITKELFLIFHEYLIQKKIDYNLEQEKQRKELQKWKRKNHNNKPGNSNYGNYYNWIDRLLETGIEDYRKITTDLILAPYLIKVKDLSFEESFQLIRNWLDKCDTVRKLDSSRNFNYRIKTALKNAQKKQIGPMSREKIKINYNKLYFLLVNIKSIGGLLK